MHADCSEGPMTKISARVPLKSFLLLATAMAPAFAQAESLLLKDSVPSSPVKDQAFVGFCWSYTVHGLMESELLKKKGITLDLSEEYVGFHHLYNQILENIPTLRNLAVFRKDSHKALTSFKRLGLEILVMGFLHPNEGSTTAQMLQRVAQVGVVPEGVFSYKIDSEGKMVENNLIKFATEHLIYKEDLDFYSTTPGRAQLYEEVAAIFGSRPPRPDDVFEYEGKKYTARTFLRDYVEFAPSDFRTVEVDKKTREAGLMAVRRALEKNIAVPLGYLIYEDMQTASETTGRFDPEQCSGGRCTQPMGGHAVLIVNGTLNDTGRPLDGVLVKNSWGPYKGLTSSGELVGDSRGFNIITASYLDTAIDTGKNWEAVLPVSVAGPLTVTPRAFPAARGSNTYTIFFDKPLKPGLISIRPHDDAMKVIMSAMARSLSVSRKRGENYDPSVAAPIVDKVEFNVRGSSGTKWPAKATITVENTSREELVLRFRDYEKTNGAR